MRKGGYHPEPGEMAVQEYIDLGLLSIAIENKQRSNTAIETANVLLAAMKRPR
jgi:hypothetical protein